MVRAYYKADRIRQQRLNDEAWLQGAYIHRAIDATICNAFRKSGQAVSYPKEPIWNDTQEDESPFEREMREESESLYAQAYMMNMVAFGKNWGKPK